MLHLHPLLSPLCLLFPSLFNCPNPVSLSPPCPFRQTLSLCQYPVLSSPLLVCIHLVHSSQVFHPILRIPYCLLPSAYFLVWNQTLYSPLCVCVCVVVPHFQKSQCNFCWGQAEKGSKVVMHDILYLLLQFTIPCYQNSIAYFPFPIMSLVPIVYLSTIVQLIIYSNKIRYTDCISWSNSLYGTDNAIIYLYIIRSKFETRK